LNASVRSASRVAVAVAAALLSTTAYAQASEGTCEELVASRLDVLRQSAWMEFGRAAQAHQTAKTIVDALSQNPNVGPGWREGNPFWEEAYALFLPDVRRQLTTVEDATMRHQASTAPRELDPEGCRKHLALLRTKPGDAAARIDQARSTKAILDSYAKAFSIAPRLEPLAKKVRGEIDAGLALKETPEVRRAAEQLRAFDQRFAEAIKKVGDGQGPEQRKANQAFGNEMVARHRDALVAIVKRFRAAGAK